MSLQAEVDRKFDEERTKYIERKKLFGKFDIGQQQLPEQPTPQPTPQKVIINPYMSASMPSSVVSTPTVAPAPVISSPVISSVSVFENNPFKNPPPIPSNASASKGGFKSNLIKSPSNA